jgi:gluconate kinase
VSLARRIAAWNGRFMPPSLLSSQLATLERSGPVERARAFDIARLADEIVAAAHDWLLHLWD